MRFEIVAAYCVGALLPIAEVLRRRTDVSDLPAYVDDFILGGLLLLAARSASKGRSAGPILVVVAWAVFCGGMYYSFFGQLANAGQDDISGLPNGAVVGIKAGFYVVGLLALVRSVRVAVRERDG